MPVGNSAITVGPTGRLAPGVKVVVVRSKATTLAEPLPTNRVLLSGLNTSPSGAESGLTPLARAAQHWAPGKPPKRLLSPKPGIWKGGVIICVPAPLWPVLQPKRVQLPNAETMGGINCVAALKLGLSVAQELAVTPPPATPFAPEKKFTATSC